MGIERALLACTNSYLKVSGRNLLLARCGVLRWCRVHHGSCGVPRSDRRVIRGRFRLVKGVVVIEVRCG